LQKRDFHFTSESVTEGHPDKVCDQISDAVLDDVIRQDPRGRVACETFITVGLVVVGGEITTKGWVDLQKLVRNLLMDIGYTNAIYGFDAKTCAILNAIGRQSEDIAQGVDTGGAGDQGCIKKGTLVKTHKGFLPIEDVKKSDLVVTPYGLKKVLETKKTGIKDLVELTLSNGMRLECTPNHKILCYERDDTTYWKEASKLNSKDFICTLKSIGFNSNQYITSKVLKKEFFTKYNHKIYGPERVTLDENLGYVMGLLVGDGYSNSGKLMEISFGKEEKHALLVKKILDKKFPNQWRLIECKDESIRLKTDSLLVRKHFENFGVHYNKSPKKTTPEAIFLSPSNVIKAYLKGLFDSDGTIIANTGRKRKNVRIRLGSSSYRLLEEAQLLLGAFGIKSSILFNAPKGMPVGKDKRYKSKYDNFVLSLVGFENYQNFAKEIGFSHPQKAERLETYLKTTQVKPKNSPSIYLLPHPYKQEMVGEELIGKSLPFSVTTLKKRIKKSKSEVYDLEIEGVNIFSANGIVVHNSMIGYACRETKELMPLPIILAHKLVKRLAEVRKKKILTYLGPDGKSQVTVEYQNGKPVVVNRAVIAAQHTVDVVDRTGQKMAEEAKREITEKVIIPALGEFYDSKKTKCFINQTGKFVIGGPQSDTGMTGRKIIVDTYGGMAPHGGGAFSGKDPTKVDRSASYMARYIAKNIVASELADECIVQLAYVIGVAEPVCVDINTFETGKVPEKRIEESVRKHFELTPQGMINMLNLLRPIYQKTAAYGHFGREEEEFTWERTDKAKDLKKSL